MSDTQPDAYGKMMAALRELSPHNWGYYAGLIEAAYDAERTRADNAEARVARIAAALERYVQYNDRGADFHEDYRSPSFKRSCGISVAETDAEWLERVLHGPARAALADSGERQHE